MKKALILFECSRTVAETFEKKGVNAWSVDILTNSNERHLIKDAYNLELDFLKSFDFIGAHPPCTYLTKANTGGNVPWCNKSGHRGIETDIDIYKFIQLYKLIEKTGKPGYIENPPFNPYTSKFINFPKFFVSGHNFESNRGKNFQLFTFNLPPLIYTKYNFERKYHSSFSSKDKKTETISLKNWLRKWLISGLNLFKKVNLENNFLFAFEKHPDNIN